MIKISNVKLQYVSEAETVTALDDVNVEIGSGEFVTVFGTSGSGKTTLLNVVAGLIEPDSGSIEVAGLSLVGSTESARAQLRLRHVGVVFQDHNLIPEFTALENVLLPLVSQGNAYSRAKVEAHEVLEAVGIGELEGRLPDQLSGGQRQRVGIARAIAGGRRVLLADEPTGALDSANSISVFGLLRELADQGVAVVVASHDPIARDFSDRTITMQDGKILSDLQAVRSE